MLAALLTGVLFGTVPAVEAPDPELLTVQRIYVERLTGGEDAAKIRDLLITALQNSKVFTITENLDRADTVLRGAASDDTYQDKFSSSERLNARTFVGGVSGNRKYSDGKSKVPVDVSVGEDESVHLEERKHEAMATIRLVSKNGDVIWSTTKESGGAKFRGAAADVADKVAKQLVSDFEKIREIRSGAGLATGSRDAKQ